MEKNQDEHIETFLEKLEQREQAARRRSLIYSLIPILVALAVAAVTSLYVADKLKELETVGVYADVSAESNEKADSLQFLVDQYQEQLNAINSAAEDRVRTQAVESFQATLTKPRVYLHILMESQRDSARWVERYLKRNGFIVPGIQRVREGPSSSELRFFRKAEHDVAAQIQQLCNQKGILMDLTDLSLRYENSTSIRPGHYEIWFGKDF